MNEDGDKMKRETLYNLDILMERLIAKSSQYKSST
jgi:hypothetical protein